MSTGTMIYATKVRDERDDHNLYYFFVGFYVTVAVAMTSVATGAAFFLLDRLTAEYDVLGNRDQSDPNLPGLSSVHYDHL